MKKCILLFIMFITQFSNAQEKIKLSGIVRDKNNHPIEMVAVSIFNANTNDFMDYIYSNVKGEYVFKVEKDLKVYLTADFMGYKDYKSEILLMNQEMKKDFKMKESLEILDVVTIYKKKNLIRIQGDKTIFDVESSGLGEGSSGLETIASLPGMRLDKDEKIVFRGNSNLQVMINGRKSLLEGDALTQYLKTVGGSNIKNIELITNPSSRYDASGTAGIINIQLKKSVNIGLTGNLSSSVGGTYLKNYNSTSLYYLKDKWSLNLSGNYYRSNSINERSIIRTVNEVGVTHKVEQFNKWLPKAKGASVKFGVEFAADKNNTFGTSLNYNLSNSIDDTEGRTNELINNNFEKYTLLKKLDVSDNKTITGNVYHSYISDSLKTKINTQFNYAMYDYTSDEQTNNTYLNSNNLKYKEDVIIKLHNPTKFNIYNTMLDIEQKITKNLTIELGTKYSYIDNKYTNEYSSKNNGSFHIDPIISSDLVYNEQVLAGYGTINFNRGKWSLQSGLRIEGITYEVNLAKNKYVSLFPSFNINRVFDKNMFKLSFSKRIDRPSYKHLNPFYKYLDTYNIMLGNPYLKPQYTNGFNLSWINKQKTSVALYSNFTTNVILNKIDYDSVSKITKITKDNMATSATYGISFFTTFSPIRMWTVSPGIDGRYNSIKSKNKNYNIDFEGFLWSTNVKNQFKFKNKWTLNVSAFYRGPGYMESMKTKAMYDMSFSLRKVYKQWSFKCKAVNVFKTNFLDSYSNQKNIDMRWMNKWETRKISLSVQYNFGKGKKKRVKAINLREEQNRL